MEVNVLIRSIWEHVIYQAKQIKTRKILINPHLMVRPVTALNINGLKDAM
jgi:hypothetical protein